MTSHQKPIHLFSSNDCHLGSEKVKLPLQKQLNSLMSEKGSYLARTVGQTVFLDKCMEWEPCMQI